MSSPTCTPTANDPRDDLAAFLRDVPAAAEYDAGELFSTPAREHRPARTNERRRAIDKSRREA